MHFSFQSMDTVDSSNDRLKRPVRELRFDEVIRLSLQLYQARFVDFFLPYIVAALLSGIMSAVAGIGELLTMDPSSFTPNLFDLLAGFFAPLISLGIVSWIFYTIASGIAVKHSSDILEKGDAGLGESFNYALSRLASLLGAGIAYFALLIVGLLCFVVPGIILAIMFSLTTPAIIIGGAGALGSFGRSRRLVSKRWGRTLAVLAVILIIQGIVSWIVNTVSSPFGVVSSIIAQVAGAAIQPIFPIATTFLYYSMVVKERSLASSGLSIEKPEEPSQATGRYCSYCGRAISSEASFCPHCGTRLR